MKRLFFLAIGLYLVSYSYIRAMERTVPIRHFVTCGNLLVKNPLERTAAGYQWVKEKIQSGIEGKLPARNGGMQVSASFLETIIGKRKNSIDQPQGFLNEEKLKKAAHNIKKSADKKIRTSAELNKMKETLKNRIDDIKGAYEVSIDFIYKIFRDPSSWVALGVPLLGYMSKQLIGIPLKISKIYPYKGLETYPLMLGFAGFMSAGFYTLSKYSEYKYEKVCEELDSRSSPTYLPLQGHDEDDPYLDIRNLFLNEENEGNL